MPWAHQSPTTGRRKAPGNENTCNSQGPFRALGLKIALESRSCAPLPSVLLPPCSLSGVGSAHTVCSVCTVLSTWQTLQRHPPLCLCWTAPQLEASRFWPFSSFSLPFALCFNHSVQNLQNVLCDAVKSQDSGPEFETPFCHVLAVWCLPSQFTYLPPCLNLWNGLRMAFTSQGSGEDYLNTHPCACTQSHTPLHCWEHSKHYVMVGIVIIYCYFYLGIDFQALRIQKAL